MNSDLQLNTFEKINFNLLNKIKSLQSINQSLLQQNQSLQIKNQKLSKFNHQYKIQSLSIEPFLQYQKQITQELQHRSSILQKQHSITYQRQQRQINLEPVKYEFPFDIFDPLKTRIKQLQQLIEQKDKVIGKLSIDLENQQKQKQNLQMQKKQNDMKISMIKNYQNQLKTKDQQLKQLKRFKNLAQLLKDNGEKDPDQTSAKFTLHYIQAHIGRKTQTLKYSLQLLQSLSYKYDILLSLSNENYEKFQRLQNFYKQSEKNIKQIILKNQRLQLELQEMEKIKNKWQAEAEELVWRMEDILLENQGMKEVLLTLFSQQYIQNIISRARKQIPLYPEYRFTTVKQLISKNRELINYIKNR